MAVPAPLAPTVYARAAGLGEVGRSEPIADGWLRFKLNATDYRQLAGAVDSAIVTVDQKTSSILSVKFRRRQS
jgi:hypothetical protein